MLRKRAFSGAAWTAAATCSTVTLQFLQLAVLARILRPEDFGLMALVMLVIGLAQTYSDAGLSSAIVYRQDATSEQLSSLFWLNVLAGLALLVILLAAAPLVARIYEDERLTGLIWLAALSFLVTPVSQQLYAQLQKVLRFDVLMFVDVVCAGVGVATSIILALRGHGVYSLVLGQLANSATRTALLFRFGLRGWRPQWRLRREDLAGYVRFGAYRMLERTVSYLGFNLDKLLIGALLGVHGLGLYNVAYQLMMKPIQLVAPVVQRVAFPLFAKVQSDDARLRAGLLDIIRLVALALFPVYAGMILLADPLTVVLLGERWQAAVPTLRLLAVLGFFYTINNPSGALLLAKGRVEMGFYLNVWMIVLYGSAIAVGARWGVNGIATGLIVATAVGLFPVGFWVRWLLVRMRPLEYLGAFVPMLVSALIMVGLLLGAEGMGVGPSAPLGQLVVSTLSGAVAYFLIVVPWQWPFLTRLQSALR